MNWKNVLSETKNIIFTKKIIAFYLLLFIFQLPFTIMYNIFLIMPYTIIINGIMPDTTVIGGEIFGLSPIEFMQVVALLGMILLPLFIVLSYIIISGIVNYVQDRRLGKSLKTGFANSKRIVPSIFLIVLLQFLILNVSNFQIMEERFIGKPVVFFYSFFDVMDKFWKPVMVLPSGIADLCVINLCSEAIGAFVYSFAFIQAIIYLFLSILSLFVVQEIIISKSGIRESIKNSFRLVKNNFRDVSILWILSSIIYMAVFLLSLFLPFGIYYFTLIGIIFIIILQTAFYLQIKDISKR